MLGDEAAGFAREFFEVAFGFEGVEVVAGGSGGAIAEGAADFADGGGSAGAADAVEDVREEFLLRGVSGSCTRKEYHTNVWYGKRKLR